MEKQLEELLDKLESGEIEADDRLLSLLSEVEEEKKEEKKRKERKEEHSELINAIKEIKIDAPVIPEIQVPEITVPPIVIPEITVPPIEVTVPEITIPKIESPKVVMPDEIRVKKPTWFTPFPSLSPLVELLKSIKNVVLSFKLPTDAKNPISVRLSDGKEFYKVIQEAYKGIAAFRPIAAYRNALGNEENGLIDADRHVQVDVLSADSVEDKLQAIRDNQDTQINQLSDVTHTNEHTGSKEIRTYLDNHICTTNTTTTPLGSNATFIGEWQDCLNYQEVNISILSDKNSAINGLVFQWSADGVNVGDTDVFSYYTASGGTNYTPNPAFRYFRVLYTNGASAQTTFNLQTILRRSMTGGSFHRIDSTLKDDNDARLTITIPKLKTAQNTYVSQTATTAGNAKVSIEEFDDSVSTDTNKLNVANYVTDERGVQSQVLGDTYYPGAQINIDIDHHEIHCGDMIQVSHLVDLTNGATRDILISIPNPVITSKRYHIYTEVTTEAEADFKFYEAVTTSNDGTSIAAYNKNRQDPTVAENEVLFYHTPTVTNTGTLIHEKHWGSGKGIGGESRGENEWVLKNNTKYLLRVNNATTSNNFISININYYVHPGV